MTNLVTISAGRVEANIDPQGAIVDSLRTVDGVDLLLPRAENETPDGLKLRGTHICMPQFGPAPDESGLTQHGFARTQLWEVQADAMVGSVHLQLDVPLGGREGVPAAYNGLRSDLTYSVFDSGKSGMGIIIGLTVQNRGENIMRFAPGFHPYFPVPEDASELKIVQPYAFDRNEVTRLLDDLNPSVTDRLARVGQPIEITIGGTVLTMFSSNSLLFLTSWTDLPKDYVCVEPTLMGNAFHNEPTAEELLTPSVKPKAYNTSLTWTSLPS